MEFGMLYNQPIRTPPVISEHNRFPHEIKNVNTHAHALRKTSESQTGIEPVTF